MRILRGMFARLFPLLATLALACCGAAPAGGRTLDLLTLEPLDARRVATVRTADLEVEGAARTDLRGATLDVVLTGRSDALLRIALPPAIATQIDRLRLTLVASDHAFVQPHWERRGERAEGGPARELRAGEATELDLVLPQEVGPFGALHPDALLLTLPAIVGRVQILGEVELWGSNAPRCTVRAPELDIAARTLAAGAQTRWLLELPARSHLLVDVNVLGTLASSPSLALHVEIETSDTSHTGETAPGSWRTRSFDLEPSPLDAAWRTLRIELDDLDRTPRRLRLRVDAAPADPDRGRVLLAAPRIVPADDPRAPILVIVIDTLRRDDPFGDRARTRPRLLELERASLDFTRARANSSWTLPSTASLLTGWLPSHHGLGHGDAATTRLTTRAPALFYELRAAGWSTAAVSANPLVAPGSGLERGFDRFDTRSARDPRAPSAQPAVQAALEWLRPRVGTAWALYLHLFDPHDPYQAPPPWRTRFVREDRRADHHPSGVWDGRPDLLRDALVAGDASVPVRTRDVELLAELHRGEIAYTDHFVGALLDSLRAWDEFDRSVILVTSDHGEEFLEHGMLKHGHALHEELIAVPFSLRVPGVAPRRIAQDVTLVDVAPTLRSILGLPEQRSDGHDLSEAWERPGSTARERIAMSELVSRAGGAWAGTWTSVVDFPWKWVQTPHAEHLFHLDRDPGEREDLAARFASIRTRLRAHADSVRATFDPEVDTAPVDPDRLEALRALGYID